MSKTLQQIIDSAEQIATGIAVDPKQSISIDSEMTAEDLFPLVVRHSFRELAAKSENFNDLSAEYVIGLSSGAGTLPVNVFNEHLDKSYLADVPLSAYMPIYADYARDKLTNQLKYYSSQGSRFYFSDESADSVRLVTPGIPDLPEDADEEIGFSRRIEDAVIYNLALALRGQLKIEMVS